MIEREHDFKTLSERISTQTEAAIEFSNAIIKIIEQTAAIRDRINDSNHLFKDELRIITSILQDFKIEFHKLSLANVNQHNLEKKDLESLQEKIKTFELQIKDLDQSFEISLDTIKNSVVDLIKYLKINIDKIADNNSLTIGEFKKSAEKQETFMNIIQEQLENQNNHMDNFQKQVFVIKVLFAVITGLSVITGILTSFNIVHIVWFSK